MDNLIIIKYFILIEFILLFIAGYLGGKNGLISILSIALFTYFIFYATALSAAYSNSNIKPNINIDDIIFIFIIIFISIFLAIGTNQLIKKIKYNAPINIFFYLWITTAIASVVFISTLQYLNNPILKEKRRIKQIIEDNNNLKKSVTELNNIFIKAKEDSIYINEYINISIRISEKYKDFASLPTKFANYTSKLMIYTMSNGELHSALLLLNSYLFDIIPNSGLSDKSSDVASLGVVLSKLLKDITIYNRVEEYILGKDFDIKNISNSVLLYNLACHYSLNREKEKLLLATSLALKHGKSSKQFFNDKDFNNYIYDKDFLYELNRENTNE